MASGTLIGVSPGCCRYKLQGLVSHEGNGWGSGHYFAQCYNNLTQNWYQFNDNRVARVSQEKVAKTQACAPQSFRAPQLAKRNTFRVP